MYKKLKKFYSDIVYANDLNYEGNMNVLTHFTNLPPDDSDDSNYEPDSADIAECSQKKRKKYRKIVPSKRQTTFKLVENGSPSWSVNIPIELLQRVFAYGVGAFGAVPFLCRCCQVCKKWNMTACSPSLWRSVDLSFMGKYSTAQDEIINSIIGRNVWSQVEHLNLSGWGKLTSSALEMISIKCTELKSLNLEKCEKISSTGLQFIADNCHNLNAINLSLMELTDSCSKMFLKKFFEKRGRQLHELRFAGNKLIGSSTLTLIQILCADLRILDLSNTSVRHLNVELFQTACPKLVELRLGQLVLVVSKSKNELEHSDGFPDLQLLSLASVTGGIGTDDNLLQSLLKTSTKLCQIDLRGCERITQHALLNLPIPSVEQLFLSRSKVAWCKHSWETLFTEIGRKWNHSLQNLDVSWGSNLNDEALLNFVREIQPNTVLTSLNLAGSGVTALSVRAILDSCSSLIELNLTSCRGVPRGFKQLHNKSSIEKLRGALRVETTQQIDVDEND